MAPKPQRFDERQNMRRNTYEIFRYKDTYLKEVALHHHDFYEIYFFLSGNVQYNIESRSYLLSPGDILLISPMELHQPMLSGEQKPYERIVLWLDKRFLSDFNLPGQNITACFDTTAPGYSNLLQVDENARQLLTFQLEMLLQESQSTEHYSEICALSYLAQVLVTLNRQAMRLPQDNRPVMADNAVYYVLRYINEHYNEELSLDFLANLVFTSKYHLAREFQRLVGTSVHRYIIQKRLVMAKQMISEGVPATEVYQHCGFGDYSNFYRAFKAEYQISPKEYANQLRHASISLEESLHRRIRERVEK